MLTATQFVATLCSALFTGAAIYVNLVEHPARMSCDTKIAATVWAPSYQRGAVMQASLAILSFMAGAAAWWFGGGFLWLWEPCSSGWWFHSHWSSSSRRTSSSSIRRVTRRRRRPEGCWSSRASSTPFVAG